MTAGATDQATGQARPVRVRVRSRGLIVVLALALLTAASTVGCGLLDKKVDVLYIGDSIMKQSGTYAEQYLVAEPGIGSAKTLVEAQNGTGLLTPKLYDWPGRARDLIETYQPKVVVVLFIGNYSDTDLWTGADGTPVANDYGPRFFEEWARQAEQLTAILSSKGAKVDWVLPPPLQGAEGERRFVGMRQTYIDLKAKLPAIDLIDAVTALGGSNGEWVWRRPGVDGVEVTVREGDSVHLTEDGGRLLAHQFAVDVAPQLAAIRARS